MLSHGAGQNVLVVFVTCGWFSAIGLVQPPTTNHLLVPPGPRHIIANRMVQDYETLSALDEISEIPLFLRFKLLNTVVEDKYFYPLSQVALKSPWMRIDDC